MMFIYIRINRNQTLVVDQYDYDMKDGETAAQAERYLLKNARPITRNNPRQRDPERTSESFDRVSFGWQPCHVVMLIDERHWKFNPWPDNAFEETIVFRKNKLLMKPGASGSLEPIEYEFEPNYSFFNFERDSIDGRQLIRFVNFMRIDEAGTKMPVPAQGTSPNTWPIWEYCMDVYIRMPYNFSKRKAADGSRLEPTEWLTLVFDPPQDNGGSGGPPPSQ